MIIMAQKERMPFSSQWEDYDLIKLGGFWCVAVGIVRDNTGIRKLRISKGKVKGKVFKDEKGEIQYELYDKKDPISQVNRLNIKSVEEWSKIKIFVEKWMIKLKKS